MPKSSVSSLSVDNAVTLLRSKKIIFVFGNLELGGAERQGLLLARYLRDVCGADVQIWGLQKKSGRLSQLCDESGIPWRGIDLNWQWGYRHIIHNLGELRRVAVLLKRESPDLILPYTFIPNLICGLVWRFTGAKLCIWNQRDEGFFLEAELWRSLAVQLTPCFIANSRQGKESLLKTFSIDEDRVTVIHNGILLEMAKSGRVEWRNRLSVNDDCFVVCMIANIHNYKDHVTLLKGWRLFLDDVDLAGVSSVLLLAGRVDMDGHTLTDIVKSLDLVDDVMFLGGVDDVAGLLGAVDLCIYSSKSEGLPNAVLEAMAVGLPVVATDIPGIREAVGPEGYRFLSPPSDSQGLADHIKELFLMPDLRACIGEIMRRRVQEKFIPNMMCQITSSLIAEHWPKR